MVVGWGLVWQFAQQQPEPVEPRAARRDQARARRARPLGGVRDGHRPDPDVVPRQRGLCATSWRRPASRRPRSSPRQSRRDIVLTHLWERPELYRGVPVHLLGTAMRVIRFESKLSKTGWLYEAWIVTPDARKYPYTCVFEEPPAGFPIGTDRLRTGRLQRLFPQDHEVPGRRRRPRRARPRRQARLGPSPRAGPRRRVEPHALLVAGRARRRCSSSPWPDGSSSSSISSPAPVRAREPESARPTRSPPRT